MSVGNVHRNCKLYDLSEVLKFLYFIVQTACFAFLVNDLLYLCSILFFFCICYESMAAVAFLYTFSLFPLYFIYIDCSTSRAYCRGHNKSGLVYS